MRATPTERINYLARHKVVPADYLEHRYVSIHRVI